MLHEEVILVDCKNVCLRVNKINTNNNFNISQVSKDVINKGENSDTDDHHVEASQRVSDSGSRRSNRDFADRRVDTEVNLKWNDSQSRRVRELPMKVNESYQSVMNRYDSKDPRLQTMDYYMPLRIMWVPYSLIP
jgi:hypothetical protein